MGWLGALDPRHVQQLDLTYPAILFELDTQQGLAAHVPVFREISKFPAIRRDIAVIVDEALPVDALRTVVRSSAGPKPLR